MPSHGLRPVLDLSPADWLLPELTGPAGLVPSGYPAHARIFHPATDAAGEPVTWAKVAEETGRIVHPEMQWHTLVGSRDPVSLEGSVWSGSNPEQGNLDPAALSALCTVLSGFTETPGRCWFALWEGWDSPGGSALVITASTDGETVPPPEPGPSLITPEQLGGPRIVHPGREYLLFTGPLRAALELGHWPTGDWFIAQSPNLFWPHDRSWFVATEIDFEWTMVAGSRELIDAVIASDGLEALPVEPDYDLTDPINLV